MRATSILLALAALMPNAARAACSDPYEVDEMLVDLVNAEAAIRDQNGSAAITSAKVIEEGLECLAEPIAFIVVGRIYRAIGGGLFLGGDEDTAKTWLSTSLELDPTFVYGIEDLPVDAPLRSTFESLRTDEASAPTLVEGKEFVEGKHFVDGVEVEVPQATPDHPHLYQAVYQEDGSDVLEGFLITGNAFPDRFLHNAKGGSAGKSRQTKGLNPIDTHGYIQRQRPWEKTPLMVIGSGTILAGVGIYILSNESRDSFDAAIDNDSLKRLRFRTNALFITSAGVIVTGMGALGWGIIVDGGGPPVPGFQIQF